MVMKYVMNKDDFPAKFLLIPDNGMKHSDAIGEWTSAGFVSIGYDENTHKFTCSCRGKSCSLGLTSDPEDSAIIERSFNLF